MRGLLLIDKPSGWTSFDVVKYVRRVVAAIEGNAPKAVKVGHSGTLDPFATGLLLVLIGRDYTSRAEKYLKMDKVYAAKLELGKVSTTADPEGEITAYKTKRQRPDSNEVKSVVRTFHGEISQQPPAYSAIKVGGVRAYALARKGLKVELQKRTVTIRAIKIISYNYPMLEIEARVSSGTYIRSLATDIGEKLGTGAYTKELRRTSIGTYSIEQAYVPDQINEQTIAGLLLED